MCCSQSLLWHLQMLRIALLIGQNLSVVQALFQLQHMPVQSLSLIASLIDFNWNLLESSEAQTISLWQKVQHTDVRLGAMKGFKMHLFLLLFVLSLGLFGHGWFRALQGQHITQFLLDVMEQRHGETVEIMTSVSCCDIRQLWWRACLDRRVIGLQCRQNIQWHHDLNLCWSHLIGSSAPEHTLDCVQRSGSNDAQCSSDLNDTSCTQRRARIGLSRAGALIERSIGKRWRAS